MRFLFHSGSIQYKRVNLHPKRLGFLVNCKNLRTLKMPWSYHQEQKRIRGALTKTNQRLFIIQAWECLSSIRGTIHKMLQKSSPFFKEWLKCQM